MKTKLFFFVRHGETDWNKLRRMQGHTDIALNEFGKVQAEQIKKLIPLEKLGRVVTSDLARAQETARIITQDLQLPFFTTASLREIHLGEVEGMAVDRIAAEHPLLWGKWSTHKYMQLQFRDGETKREMLDRVILEIEKHVPEEDKSVLFVSHGLVIRTLIHFFRQDLKAPFLIPNCACLPCEYLGPRNYRPLIESIQTIPGSDSTFHQKKT